MAKHVVVVEDSPLTSAILCRHLAKNKSYQVVAFLSAEEALASFKDKFPDVLIIDYQLPGMSGIDLFDKIKPMTPASSVVIMASAVEDGNLVLRFIQKGVRNFLIKDDTMTESLQEILDEEVRK